MLFPCSGVLTSIIVQLQSGSLVVYSAVTNSAFGERETDGQTDTERDE